MPRAGGPGPERRALLKAGAAAAATAAGLATATDAVAAPPQQASRPGGGAVRAVRERAGKAPSGRWDTFNLSPARRTVRPVAVRTTTGSVERAQDLLGKDGAARTRLSGRGASVTLDFGKEVGGFVTVALGEGTERGRRIGLAYAELSSFLDAAASDGSNGGANDEPAVVYAAPPGGTVSTERDTPLAGTGAAAAANPASQLRGGFRYLTVTNESDGTVALAGCSVRITFAPDAADLRAYPNYFYCDDDLLNRIWYAGAYTVQTNIIAPRQGRVWGPPELGWDNSALVGETGDPVLVDGAKRDRTVWPGDLGVSVLTDHVSLGDLAAVRASLDTLYRHQTEDGALPYAGPAVNFLGTSDAYHLWTLVGTALYVRFSGDTGWLRERYPGYLRALDHITAKLDGDGLLAVTAAADWARTDADGKNLEANAVMYHALVTAAPLARAAGDPDTATACVKRAEALKSAVAAGGYWDEAAGLYRDKPEGPGAALYPQDGNALAVWFGLADEERARRVSAALAGRWTAVGALSPEKSADSVHPFPGGMEVHAHFTAGEDRRALDLIRREWGYMLGAPQGTASTFWEGYLRDGSPDYQGSYMSASHGWSTGPTSALTHHLLGIRPAPGGGYLVSPSPGGLAHAQGRLSTPAGVIAVSWRGRPNGWFDLTLKSPEGVASVGVPVPAEGPTVVRRDGRRAWDRTSRYHGVRLENGHVILPGLPPGTHTVTVRRR
ncbi:alpha-L-rhamnosidase C-terminal domain-containing protein [Streptomyces sp. NPDC050560]|uniref:alpha-L-rhamnosidase-related protein n=1 Tax=Streptomyces sp. NPDC050560 TaxID=3365630 RepID=UPI0037B8356E